MRLAKVYSRAIVGIRAVPVTVEVQISPGLPSLSIVGLPEIAVRESKDRVRAALLSGGYEFPRGRVTINLAPADLPKAGSRFDLAIAMGVLAASEQIFGPLDGYEFIGELALDGSLRGVSGVLPTAMAVRETGRVLVVPWTNEAEAGLVPSLSALCAQNLLQVGGFFSDQDPGYGMRDVQPTRLPDSDPDAPDMADVRGQYKAKRALEVAASGGHNLLMVGPPGSGKTMLASRLPGILPPMTEDEALQSATVQSISDQGLDLSRWRTRVFRSPHHTASGVALVGGGSFPKPGEISLAHQGILFLDELPEFDRRVLEVLREPMESGRIMISRAARQSEFPAKFQLIAAMNPCPCGYFGDPEGRCDCTEDQVKKYRGKISGPLLDRFDLHVEVPAVPKDHLFQTSSDREKLRESSRDIQSRVVRARHVQMQRCGRSNARLRQKQIENFCALDEESRAMVELAMDKLKLSARAFYRVLKVARTIADMAEMEAIQKSHVLEALSYRMLDRKHPI